MSQHDFDIANQGMPAARTDVNNAILALASLSSGTSQPATPTTNQLWLDTTADPNVLNFYDGTDDIEILQINVASNFVSSLATGAIKIYDFIDVHLAEKYELARRINAIEMKVCDMDAETFWYRGDCLERADFSRPDMPD